MFLFRGRGLTLSATICPAERRPLRLAVKSSPRAECRLLGAPRAPERVITLAGLLARGSSFGRAFPGFPSGIIRRHSPLTVAGAAVEFHHVPFSSGLPRNRRPLLHKPRQGRVKRGVRPVSRWPDRGSQNGAAAVFPLMGAPLVNSLKLHHIVGLPAVHPLCTPCSDGPPPRGRLTICRESGGNRPSRGACGMDRGGAGWPSGAKRGRR